MTRATTPSPAGLPVRDRAQRFFALEPAPELLSVTGTVGDILDAARRCMFRFGLSKTSMTDVAEVAGVSRATIYNHFQDREKILDAVMLMGSDLCMDDFAAAMASGDTLDERLARGALVLDRWRRSSRQMRWGALMDDASLAVLVTVNAEEYLSRLRSILRPHVASARDSGETRSDLDVDGAVEWLTRILHLIFVIEPPAPYSDDEGSLAAWVKDFALRGLD